MLKDYLLDWCQKEYQSCHSGHCGSHCDNKEHCTHNCDDCLDQVHWYPSRAGRADYTCLNLILRYVLRFTQKYSQQIASALQVINPEGYPRYSIFSIGCGGSPDLMAFEELEDMKPIYYKGYDRNEFWCEIHDRIEKYAKQVPDFDVKLRRKDIFDVFSDGIPQNRQYNVVVIQYLLSHLYNTGQEMQMMQLFDAIINCLLAQRIPDSPFLIIITDVDSINKGRSEWYNLLDKLENAGYHGIAYARSVFPTGDLGRERWSRHKESACFGNINYAYLPTKSEHDGAQLIIELR